ncbi:hypothetical protein MD484_g7958, partial [Candolleomyces efflorescens]
MKLTLRLISLVSIVLCAIVHAAPAPLCDRTNGLCGDIAARDVADSVVADDLVARAAKSAAKAKIQRQNAAKIRVEVKPLVKQANKRRTTQAKADAQAKSLRSSVQTRLAKEHKAAKTKAWAAAANRDTTTKNILAIQKHQGQKPQRKARKKEANDLVRQNAAGSINAKVKSWREQEKKAGGYMPRVNILADRLRVKEKERALTQGLKDRKAARGKAWADKKKSPEERAKVNKDAADRRKQRVKYGNATPLNAIKLEKNIKLTKQEKKNVKDRFAAAKEKHKQLKDTMPKRGQTATVGSSSAQGRDIRNSVFNSNLHRKNPLGTQRMPKKFNNDPYSKIHGTLANQRPLPATAKRLKEYPIIRNSPNGWTGNGPVGPLRTVTYKDGGRRHAAVIGHDTNPARGGNADDHYVATVTRDIQSSELVDFE